MDYSDPGVSCDPVGSGTIQRCKLDGSSIYARLSETRGEWPDDARGKGAFYVSRLDYSVCGHPDLD